MKKSSASLFARLAADPIHTPCEEQTRYAADHFLPIRIVFPKTSIGLVLTYHSCYISETFITEKQHKIITKREDRAKQTGDCDSASRRPYTKYPLSEGSLRDLEELETIPTGLLFLPNCFIISSISQTGLPDWDYNRIGRPKWASEYTAKHPPRGILEKLLDGRSRFADVATAKPTSWGIFDPFGLIRTHASNTKRHRGYSTLGPHTTNYASSMKTDLPYPIRSDRMMSWYIGGDDLAGTRICMSYR